MGVSIASALAGLSAVGPAIKAVTGVAGTASDLASGLGSASGGGQVLAAGDAADPLSDDKFLDEYALVFAASYVEPNELAGKWKDNRNQLRTPDNIAGFQKLGLISDPLTEEDQKFIDRFALTIAASPVPRGVTQPAYTHAVLSQWLRNRTASGVRSSGNLAFFKELGVI